MLAARPRLDTECLDLVDLLSGADRVDRPGGEHAPTLAHSVVHSVDFELTGSSDAIAATAPSRAERKMTASAKVLKLTGRATGLSAERKTTRPTPPPPRQFPAFLTFELASATACVNSLDAHGFPSIRGATRA